MEHQDWTPVTFTKKTVEQKKEVSVNKQNYDAAKHNERVNSDDYKPKTITSKMAQEIRNGRSMKKLTQKQLAVQSGIQENLIKDYENSKGVYNAGNLNKIAKVLGIKITR